jgi:hypothetical protein
MPTYPRQISILQVPHRLDALRAQTLHIAWSDTPDVFNVDFCQQPIQFVLGKPGQRDDVSVLRVVFGDLVCNFAECLGRGDTYARGDACLSQDGGAYDATIVQQGIGGHVAYVQKGFIHRYGEYGVMKPGKSRRGGVRNVRNIPLLSCTLYTLPVVSTSVCWSLREADESHNDFLAVELEPP